MKTKSNHKNDNSALYVLTYHRILEKTDPLQPDLITQKEFDFQMWLVKKLFTVIDLEYALKAQQNNNLPSNAICISFDDGYLDNYTHALPILKKHDMSATFFLISSAVSSGENLWYDNIIEQIRNHTEPHIDLTKLGLKYFSMRTNDQKQQAINAILEYAKHLHSQELKIFIDNFNSLVPCRKQTQLMMTKKEVLELMAESMQIGSHGVEHHILSTQDSNQSRINIKQSKHDLEEMLNIQINLYAYPNGKKADFNQMHTDYIEQSGYSGALTSCYGSISKNSDRFTLNRITCWPKGIFKQFIFFMRLRLEYIYFSRIKRLL